MKKVTLYITITLIVFVLDIFVINTPKKAESKELNQNKEQTSNNEESSDIEYYNISSIVEPVYGYSNSKTIAEHSDYIAIIKIDSIDGGSNVNRKTGEPVVDIYAYGKAKVLVRIKGALNSNILYTRPGGSMPYDEWILNETDGWKIDELVKGKDNKSTMKIIVNSNIIEDIKIETGKTYLAYMVHSDEFNYDNEYVIIGYQYGLREYKDGKVKNNTTGEWEELSKIVDIK